MQNIYFPFNKFINIPNPEQRERGGGKGRHLSCLLSLSHLPTLMSFHFGDQGSGDSSGDRTAILGPPQNGDSNRHPHIKLKKTSDSLTLTSEKKKSFLRINTCRVVLSWICSPNIYYLRVKRKSPM